MPHECGGVGAPPDLQMDEPDFRRVEQAWFDHSILLLRGLAMTPEQHVAFTSYLGKLHIMEPLELNLPGHPEVFVVSNANDGKPIGLKRAGEGFHTDGEDKRIPNAGSSSTPSVALFGKFVGIGNFLYEEAGRG
jgi:alpha-ketoglutarate-dependent taurine dioxygenase